jgi:hypothetical protein
MKYLNFDIDFFKFLTDSDESNTKSDESKT